MPSTAGYFQSHMDGMTPPKELVQHKDKLLKLLQGVAATFHYSWVVSTQVRACAELPSS